MKNGVNEQIINWIIERVNSCYKDDVAIVAIYGSYVNNTTNKYSDVDCYFIPKTNHGEAFATDFIIDGIGYDIFPMSWERVERIANLEEMLLPCVGDTKIIFSSSDADKGRFEALQERLKLNIADGKCTENVAAKCLANASEQYALMLNAGRNSEIRMYACNVMLQLANSIATYNHTYFHYGLKMQYHDLQKMGIPPELLVAYTAIIKADTKEESVSSCHKMMELVSSYINAELQMVTLPSEMPMGVVNLQVNYEEIVCFYEEIISTFNKIYYAVETNDYILAFISAASLQQDLDEITVSNNLPFYDLLDSYKWDNLEEINIRTQAVQQALTQLIAVGGATIGIFDTFEAFCNSRK